MKITKQYLLTLLYMLKNLSLSNKDDYRYYQSMKRRTKCSLMLEYLVQCEKCGKDNTYLYDEVLNEYNKYFKVKG